MWIMASETSRRCSYTCTRRRQRIIQPKVRSATHRRGRTWKPWGTFDLADRLDDEVEEGGLVRQRSEIIGAVGNEMFDPGPALTNGVENRLATGRPRCLPSSD